MIVLASDHAGFALKTLIAAHLKSREIEVLDLGTDSEASVDYPDFGHAAALAVSDGRAETGIIACGSGIGISIAANRAPIVRCALCLTPEMAQLARQHNDANILALGARLTDEQTALECVDAFLNTEFEGERHAARVEKLSPPTAA